MNGVCRTLWLGRVKGTVVAFDPPAACGLMFLSVSYGPGSEVAVASKQTTRVDETEVGRALLDIVEQLAADYPTIPTATLYATAGEASVIAAGELPDLTAYRAVLAVEARRRLDAEA